MIRVKMQARNAIIAANRDMLQKRKDAYVLKATRDGVVSQILEQPGNVINAGLPIMTLVTERPDHVIGFLPEVHLAELEAGDKVRVWRQTGGPGRGVAAVVESISPDVQGLPTRINPIRGQILRGRRVMVRFAEAHDFVPGETVEIREVKAGWGATFVDVWSRLFR
jgi:hypothetical protein